MIDKLKKITVVTGHYGSGKTNLAVNLAVDLSHAGKKVVLVDLDIVNPYFRSADFKDELKAMGIDMIFPLYANTNLDIPALGADIYSVFNREDDRYVILDVGGDDAGAAALGRYASLIRELPYEMLYVVNRYRYLTREPEEALGVMREIEYASRLSVTAVVNNSNLGSETGVGDILSSISFGEEAASAGNVPLMAFSYPKHLSDHPLCENGYPVDIYVRAPWDK